MKMSRLLTKPQLRELHNQMASLKGKIGFSRGYSYYVDIFKGTIILVGRSYGNRLLYPKPIHDSEDLRNLKPTVDIGIFIGYSPAKKAYWLYNKRKILIMETIHVKFDELIAMAYEQFASGPIPQLLTSRHISLGLIPNPSSPSVVSLVPPDVAPLLANTIGTPPSTIIDQDAPSASTSPTIEKTQAPVIHQDGDEVVAAVVCGGDGTANVGQPWRLMKMVVLQEVMVVRHFRIEVVIEVKRLFFFKLVLHRFVSFLRSLENMNMTLRIKNGRYKEESMGMKKEEVSGLTGTSMGIVKDAEKEENNDGDGVEMVRGGRGDEVGWCSMVVVAMMAWCGDSGSEVVAYGDDVGGDVGDDLVDRGGGDDRGGNGGRRLGRKSPGGAEK
uniref:Retroviral polymerase SH3-like domain-containing protein n=1 Tax=Tanacetum cinerariifolium TaxID=118510 RepID=A0A6L2NH86_TANCI|nr:hypothetical protein [Tanacetum cinerariifolium]